MSIFLELLGKGLEPNLMRLVLPGVGAGGWASKIEPYSDTAQMGPANWLREGIHHAENGRIDEAVQCFGRIAAQDSGHVEMRLAWAAMHLWDAALDEAVTQLQLAAAEPGDARVSFALGYCYERLGQSDKALTVYNTGVGKRPYLRQLRERRAGIHMHRQDYAAALAECAALSKEHPEDMWLYLALGHLHLHREDYDAAVDAFERALTIEPDNFEMRDDKVEALLESGRVAEAIAALQDILQTQGDFPDTYVRLGDAHSQMRDDEAAVRCYGKALELHPGYLEASVKLGTQHLRHKRFLEAATYFSRAVEINDQLVGAYVGLGVAQAQRGQRDNAHDTFNLAASLEPNTNLLFAETCRLQLRLAQGKYGPALHGGASEDPDALLDKQIDRHREALAETPNHADLRYRYGLLLRGRGEMDAAQEQFRLATEINGSYAKAKIKLGLLLREEGKLEEGLGLLCEALTLRPEYVDLHYKLGLLYCDKIRFALAVEHFESAFQMDNEHADVQANLGLALQNMGLVDRVTATWRAVCELEPGSAMAFQSQRMAAPLATP